MQLPLCLSCSLVYEAARVKPAFVSACTASGVPLTAAADVPCDGVSFTQSPQDMQAGPKTLICFVNVLPWTQWRCLQGMLWYTGPVPLPGLTDASCRSAAGLLPGLLPHAEGCRDVGMGSRKPIFPVSISTAGSGGVGRRQQLAEAEVSALCCSDFLGFGVSGTWRNRS